MASVIVLVGSGRSEVARGANGMQLEVSDGPQLDSHIERILKAQNPGNADGVIITLDGEEDPRLPRVLYAMVAGEFGRVKNEALRIDEGEMHWALERASVHPDLRSGTPGQSHMQRGCVLNIKPELRITPFSPYEIFVSDRETPDGVRGFRISVNIIDGLHQCWAALFGKFHPKEKRVIEPFYKEVSLTPLPPRIRVKQM